MVFFENETDKHCSMFEFRPQTPSLGKYWTSPTLVVSINLLEGPVIFFFAEKLKGGKGLIYENPQMNCIIL